MVSKNLAKPLYLQVQESLEKKIMSGVYSEGTKLPSEKELCDEYSVSRITIRQALELLEIKGLTVPVHGKGTFVKTTKMDSHLQKVRSFGDMLASMGYKGYTRIDLYEENKSSDMDRLVHGWDWTQTSSMHLTGYSESEPVVVYHSVIRHPYGARMYEQARALEKEGTPFSTFDLYHKLGIRIGKIRQQVVAVNAPLNIARTLNLSEGDAVLVLESVILDKDMQPIEYKKGYYRTDKYTFILDREI